MNINILSVLVGHLLGDFFFQTKRMADHKYLPGWKNAVWCAFHVSVYTLTVCTVARVWEPLFVAGVALPHFLIDRYSLARRWMHLTGSATLAKEIDPVKNAFGVVIYVVTDQTLHLLSYIVLFHFYKI